MLKLWELAIFGMVELYMHFRPSALQLRRVMEATLEVLIHASRQVRAAATLVLLRGPLLPCTYTWCYFCCWLLHASCALLRWQTHAQPSAPRRWTLWRRLTAA